MAVGTYYNIGIRTGKLNRCDKEPGNPFVVKNGVNVPHAHVNKCISIPNTSVCRAAMPYVRARRALCGRRHMYAGPAELGGTVGTCTPSPLQFLPIEKRQQRKEWNRHYGMSRMSSGTCNLDLGVASHPTKYLNLPPPLMYML